MATNVELDETLMKEAVSLGQRKSKRAAIQDALREYVQRRKQIKVTRLFGTIEYNKSYD
ncbi:MAG: type II toxin-antitoxin system VapB family antitoxin [Methylacidiphilales bacterium]|nr:type II toxin-antitoxin system VapB family antitoxin [Candidatus Methylacidiphilales bacterium]